jgi:hypothetical protein
MHASVVVSGLHHDPDVKYQLLICAVKYWSPDNVFAINYNHNIMDVTGLSCLSNACVEIRTIDFSGDAATSLLQC